MYLMHLVMQQTSICGNRDVFKISNISQEQKQSNLSNILPIEATAFPRPIWPKVDVNCFCHFLTSRIGQDYANITNTPLLLHYALNLKYMCSAFLKVSYFLGLPLDRCLRFMNSLSSTIQKDPKSSSYRTKHLCRDRLVLIAFCRLVWWYLPIVIVWDSWKLKK